MRLIILAAAAVLLAGCGNTNAAPTPTTPVVVTTDTSNNVMSRSDFEKAVAALGHPSMTIDYDNESKHWVAKGSLGRCTYELDQSSVGSRSIELDKFGGKDNNLKASDLELPSLQNVKFGELTKAAGKAKVKQNFSCLR
ncbi:MAG TPA: hypothetical protein VFZ48_00030 [Candidatus Saccharimonadales bacterium]